MYGFIHISIYQLRKIRSYVCCLTYSAYWSSPLNLETSESTKNHMDLNFSQLDLENFYTCKKKIIIDFLNRKEGRKEGSKQKGNKIEL